MKQPIIKLALVLALALTSSSLAACDDDGGGSTCTLEYVIVSVRVVDADGAAVSGATVTATNLGSGKVMTGTTGGSGFTSDIGESIGAGTVELVATHEGRTSDTGEVEWTCDDCHCIPSPGSVTLTLD